MKSGSIYLTSARSGDLRGERFEVVVLIWFKKDLDGICRNEASLGLVARARGLCDVFAFEVVGVTDMCMEQRVGLFFGGGLNLRNEATVLL